MARRANNGEAVTARTPLKVGDKVQAQWNGMWYPAEVIEVMERGRVKVHYSGWGDYWDEAVPRSRLRLGGVATGAVGYSLGAPAEPLSMPTWYTSMDRMLHGRPVTAETPLRPGDTVQAEWHGAWWPAEVVEVRPDGAVRVRYPGWGDHWNETVPRTRLALHGTEPREVVLHFAPDWSLRGRLVEVQQEFLILEDEAGRRLHVNKQRVAYWEVSEPPGPRDAR
jgi:hypothetical protein